MKRVKWLIVPGLLIAIALFSYSFFQQQLQILRSDPTPLQTQEEIEKSWNRPAPQTPLVSNTLILFVSGPLSNDSFPQNWLQEIKPQAHSGFFSHANTQDESYMLFQLLSGQNESVNQTHTPNGYQSNDHLLHLAQFYRINTTVYSSLPVFPLEKAVSVSEGVNASGLPTGPNQLTLLSVHTDRDQISGEQINQWIRDYEATIQKNQLTSQVLLCYLPDQKNDGISWIRNTTAQSSYLYWNTLPADKEAPLPSTGVQPIENLTATIAYSMGVVPPQGCLGKPIVSWFPIDEASMMKRFVYHTDQVIFSTVFFLNQYQLDDAIITGYLLEANDTIHATDSATLVELERRYQVILDDFNSFHLFRQKQMNRIPSLIFTLMSLLVLLVWLYNWLTRYRPYLVGVLFFASYVLLEQYIFPARLSLPVITSLSLWGFVGNELLFILPILTVIIIIYTLLAGYWFDITYEEICQDWNGIMISMAICMLVLTATWVNRFGYIHLAMMPPFGVQQNQFHHLSLWILMPFLLVFSYSVSYGLIRLIMALGPANRKHS